MRIARLFHPAAKPGAAIEAAGDDFHHLARVLRRRPGDEVIVLDGRGGAFRGTIESLDPGRSSLTVAVGEPLPAQESSAIPLTVALGIPRGDAFELALRWSSEAGLHRLIPLLAARGVVRISPGDKRESEKKLERWRRIARESAEQCLRGTPLEVDPPARFDDLLLRRREWRDAFIAVPGGPDLAASGLLEAFAGREAKGEDPDRPVGEGRPDRAGTGPGAGAAPAGPEERARGILVLVGPEGGFEPAEVSRAAAAGFLPAGLPTPVLRAPTAVIFLAALAAAAAAVWAGAGAGKDSPSR